MPVFIIDLLETVFGFTEAMFAIAVGGTILLVVAAGFAVGLAVGVAGAVMRAGSVWLMVHLRIPQQPEIISPRTRIYTQRPMKVVNVPRQGDYK